MPSLQSAAVLPYALLLMEAAGVFPVVMSWWFGRHPAAPWVTLLPLTLGFIGFASTRVAIPRRWHRWRSYAGAPVGVVVFALAWGRPELSPVGFAAWLIQSIPTALLCTFFWWRGVGLGVEAPSARWVLNGFAGLGLFLMLEVGAYREQLGVDDGTALLLVLVFLGAGLLATGLARQEEAGSDAGGRSAPLVGLSAMLLVGGAGLIVAGRTQIEAVVRVALSVLALLFALLAAPFLWLLSFVQLDLVLPERPARNALNALERGEQGATPQWLEWLVIGLSTLVGVVALIGLALFGLLLIDLLRRFVYARIQGRKPAAVEMDGPTRDDAAAALARLRALLGRFTEDLAERLPHFRETEVHSAEGAYRVLARWARRRGWTRTPAETPRAFRRRLSEAMPSAGEPVELITEAYVYARYGSTPWPAERLHELRQALRALHALPPSAAQSTA